jgi:hypothetical protein
MAVPQLLATADHWFDRAVQMAKVADGLIRRRA